MERNSAGNAGLQYLRCKCGVVITPGGDGLCLKCRSNQLLPQCGYFRYKTDNFVVPVPWCDKDNDRVITRAGFKCRGCEERNG